MSVFLADHLRWRREERGRWLADQRPHDARNNSLVRLPWSVIIMFMEAITALLGAVVGGLLVLVGDIFRHRAERRDRAVERILGASANFAMVINKTCGEMIDARLQNLPRPASALRAERHEATTQFFMTPAPSDLHNAGRALVYAYHDLYDQFERDDAWAVAWDKYRIAILAYEAAVRGIAGREANSWGAKGSRILLRGRRKRAKDPTETDVDLPPSIRPYGWRRGSGNGPVGSGQASD